MQGGVSGLSLESYLQLHQALTKHGQVVQSVTPIEECYYKIADLRQLIQLHGFTASKFNRAELLAALKGQQLINPYSSSSTGSSSSSSNSSASKLPDAAGGTGLPFSAADVCSVLGIQGANPQGLRFLPLGPAASVHAAAGVEPQLPAAGADTHEQHAPHVADGAEAVAAAASPLMAAAAAAVPAASSLQPQPSVQPQQQSGTAPPQQEVQATAGTTHKQPQQDPTSKQQPQQQALLHGVAGPSTAHHSTSQAGPLHQLLASLLTQHTGASAPAGNPTQQQQQQQPQPALLASLLSSQHALPSNSADLIMQLLARGAGPAHTTGVLPAANTAGASTAPTAPAGAAAPSDAPPAELQPAADPGQASHTPWLQPQLQWLAEHGLRVARPAAAAERCSSGGGLLGCRVGFVLLEEMQVAGPRNTLLTLPAGFFEGMAVKYLGSSCQHEVCEADCPGQHQFYRACVLPPRALPEPGSSNDDLAASLAQAHAASSGRPILLILDLHPRLRSDSLDGVLQIATPEQLQDAWVLLEHEEEPSSSPPQPAEPEEGLPPARLPHKRGRKAGTAGAGQHHKRSKG